MTAEGATELYLQVEQALKDFQKGVANLKSQQRSTEALLTRGNEALENLASQIARTEKIQAEVAEDLRLLEKFRQAQAEENAVFAAQVQEELHRHSQATGKALDNLRTDLSLRRRELLGLLDELREEVSQGRQSLLGDIRKQGAVISQLEEKIQLLENYASRQRHLEGKQKLLFWGYALLLALLVAAMLF
ncbi:MAG TPA: hypothetical protein PKN71_03135 [Bacillota bacterium]|jgi:DNA repair exonuclease SbcCD ATPase subunit|nr:hypothetical protein [Bacillota bacterium]HPZ22018.1 hypothetical protein [Bacillota bacterium]HQD19766.1 hypothetical protein [Bacillota bacterium]